MSIEKAVGSPVLRWLRLLAKASAFAVLVSMWGCAPPSVRGDRVAQDNGFSKLVLEGAPFRHVAYFKPGKSDRTLHVYIEHDGTPWATSTQPALDPTPTNPLMLRLMALDPAPVLYLGRPCYWGTADAAPCEPIWWTHRRFSRTVVDSMNAALDAFVRGHPTFESLDFFGYSGGGVLAALMVPHFDATRRLVTVAAPLDLDGWTALHHYTTLAGSISPLTLDPLPSSISQLHLAGAEDSNVPAELVRPFVMKQATARLEIIAPFSHYCCWEQVWVHAALGLDSPRP